MFRWIRRCFPKWARVTLALDWIFAVVLRGERSLGILHHKIREYNLPPSACPICAGHGFGGKDLSVPQAKRQGTLTQTLREGSWQPHSRRSYPTMVAVFLRLGVLSFTRRL